MGAVRVLSWRGVAPTSIPLNNTIKGVACVQTFIQVGNASCLSRFDCCSGTSSFVVATSKRQKF